MTPLCHIEHRVRLRRDRSRRVILLIVGIVVLSLADLIVTLWHLTSVGMAEANPIAAWIIAAGPADEASRRAPGTRTPRG